MLLFSWGGSGIPDAPMLVEGYTDDGLFPLVTAAVYDLSFDSAMGTCCSTCVIIVTVTAGVEDG